MRRALTIAGSDSSAGAGIQADLKTFAAHGVYGTSAITAVTAQHTYGIAMIQAMPDELVTAQIEAVVSDIGVDAVKTGMLPTAAIVEAVAAAVQALDLPMLVVDPVMVSKSGNTLAGEEAVAALRTELLEHAFLVTPNVPEAEALAGLTILSDDDRRESARRIHAFGPRYVLIKGGHLGSPTIVDLLFDGTTFTEFPVERIAGPHTHGTGCTYAAAVAARLALGHTLVESIPLVQQYVAGAIRRAPQLGHGHGPMQHFWREKPWVDGR